MNSNLCIWLWTLIYGIWFKKNPKEARELGHRCQCSVVEKIKGCDFKELGKTCCNVIKRTDVADIINPRKGPELRHENVEISQLRLGGGVCSKFSHSSATIQASKCVLLFCACDPTLTLSPTTSSSHQQCLSKLPFSKLEKKDFYNVRVLWVGLYCAVTVLLSHFYSRASNMLSGLYLLCWSLMFSLLTDKLFTQNDPQQAQGYIILGGHSLKADSSLPRILSNS